MHYGSNTTTVATTTRTTKIFCSVPPLIFSLSLNSLNSSTLNTINLINSPVHISPSLYSSFRATWHQQSIKHQQQQQSNTMRRDDYYYQQQCNIQLNISSPLHSKIVFDPHPLSSYY
ncbi:hypothetical protein Glove_13g154 [Diversispora epigaea]|uniref:Uncharacterized protein n=1 Tax=Diversispora epigaea TaxID=1348612 RepID=A0A397JS13_9GLOM|nr:hypothetical protein Glove_13g154 [Diversispora epigaea]